MLEKPENSSSGLGVVSWGVVDDESTVGAGAVPAGVVIVELVDRRA